MSAGAQKRAAQDKFAAEFVETARRSLPPAEFHRLQQITQVVISDPEVAAFAKPVKLLPPAPAACLELAERALEAGDQDEACRCAAGGLERAGAGYAARAMQGQAEALISALRLQQTLPRSAKGPKHQPEPGPRERESQQDVVLCGGIGAMEAQYKAVCTEWGYGLVYCEDRNDVTKLLRGGGRLNLAAVLVCTSVGAKTMHGHGQEIATRYGVRLITLRTAGQSCLGQALAALRAKAAPVSP